MPSRPLLAVCSLFATFAGCEAPSPAGDAATTSSAQRLSCSSPLPGTALEALSDAPPLPAVTPLSPTNAAAKQSFDHEQWEQAIKGFDVVLSGSDDDNNKQSAEYWRAIALYRVKRTADAAATVTRIAQRPQHAKFRETLLWIAKLTPEEPSLVRATRFYRDDAIEAFNNANQRESYAALAFLLGRERFERKEWASSVALLEHVLPDSPYHAAAQECLQAARAKAGGR